MMMEMMTGVVTDCDTASAPDRVLANVARLALKLRAGRARWLPAAILGEPAWDMLLDLFVSHVDGFPVPTTSLSVAAGVPPTTGLRWIAQLEAAGIVTRAQSPEDRRVNEVRLTDEGLGIMRACLGEMFASNASPDIGCLPC